MHIHYHIYCSFADSWLHPLSFVLTIMMPDVPNHPHGIPLQEVFQDIARWQGSGCELLMAGCHDEADDTS